MKYPECCYRIGNYAKSVDGGGNIYTFAGDKDKNQIGVQAGIDHLSYCDIDFVSITAETLAVLAIENREDIMFDFRILKMGSEYNYRVTIIHDYVGTKSFVKNDNEPFGEFLLRVAIERNYLPKEK